MKGFTEIGVIDGYVFSVHENVKIEIERRTVRLGKKEDKKRKHTSPIGLGAVQATLLKDPARVVLKNYSAALAQIVPTVSEVTKVLSITKVPTVIEISDMPKASPKKQYEDIFKDFFKIKDAPTKTETVPKRQRNDKKDRDAIERNTIKLFDNLRMSDSGMIIPPSPKKKKVTIHIPEAVRRYHKRCLDNVEYGAVGLVPAFLLKEQNLPHSLEKFADSLAGGLLIDFCKKNNLK